MKRFLRQIWCALGHHDGYVDGGFHCAYCPFEIPYEHDDALVATWVEQVAARPPMQLGDDVKAMYPEQWQQDAILQAWNTGKTTVGKRPEKPTTEQV